MPRILIIINLLLIIAVPEILQAQSYTLSGYLQDAETGENLIGATVYSETDGKGTTSNYYGFYSLTLPAGEKSIVVSYVGFAPLKAKIVLVSDLEKNFGLQADQLLQEVVITGEIPVTETAQMSTVSINAKEVNQMPAFLGESDVMKAIQFLPGIQSGNEGATGLYVRGGGPDQNLVLLDGVPVYNASHLFGFFSVFNTDAINHVEVVKGGFPARYGGRLSSVIDISLKEGNNKNLKVTGSVGLISAKATVEGPLGSENTSFIFSARRTYLDLLASPLIRSLSEGENRAGYYFYDLNAKINHRFSAKDRLYVSAYTGKDVGFTDYEDTYRSNGRDLAYREAVDLDWGNFTTAVRWNHLFSNKLFGNLTATYSTYDFNVANSYTEEVQDQGGITEDSQLVKYSSGIRDLGLKADLDLELNPEVSFRAGGGYTAHRFTPGVLALRSTLENDTITGSGGQNAGEYSVYLESHLKPLAGLVVNLGVHHAGFLVNETVYTSVQPRLSAGYQLKKGLSVKASYATMTQFVHLLTNSGIGLPTDLWVPATDNVAPQQAQQWAAGIVKETASGYEIGLELYHKNMQDLIAYREGASFLQVDTNWESKVTAGDGQSQGLELLLRKKRGRLTGWIGYTLSKTTRQFPELNNGREFPYRYDRRHDISVVGLYKLKDNLDLSGTWVYATGNAITIPVSQYAGGPVSQQGFAFGTSNLQQYSSRNGYRMRAYHRLDVNLTWTKQKKHGERSWSVGVYNLYSRANPFYVATGFTASGEKKFIQYSLFPIIPSVRYGFSF